MQRDGIRAGDRVGRIGGRYCVGWATLLGVTVVAELPRADARIFWEGSAELQAEVIEAFRQLDVTAIVAEQIPPGEVYRPGPGWVSLADGSFFVYKMPAQTGP